MPEHCKIAVIGDPHVAVPLGSNDERMEIDPGRKLHGLSVELLTETIAQVNATEDLACAMILGDMTRDSELFNHKVAKSLVDTLKVPYYIVVGNHDLKRQRKDGVTYPDQHRLDRRELCEFYGDQGLPDAMTRYVVELPGNVVLVVMDSNRTIPELASDDEKLSAQDDGRIGEEQIAWLDGVLTQIRAGGRFPLVAVHHSVCEQSPAERPGHALNFVFRSWQVEDNKAVREVLAKHKVPLVLSGHLHAQSIGIEDGIANLITSATVSYPHTWRLLDIGAGTIKVTSHRVEAVPSCANLQEKSRAWLGDGMGLLIEEKAKKIPMLAAFTKDLNRMVTRSGWWTRFCDGTLTGFKVDKACIPNGNPVTGMVFAQVEKLLNEFGTWKADSQDPNELEIPME